MGWFQNFNDYYNFVTLNGNKIILFCLFLLFIIFCEYEIYDE